MNSLGLLTTGAGHNQDTYLTYIFTKNIHECFKKLQQQPTPVQANFVTSQKCTLW